MLKFNLNLRFFEEGGGTSGEGAAASASESAQAAAEPQAERTTDSAGPGTEETFESLVGKGGKYKAEFDAAMQKAISKRFGKAKENEAKLSKLDPIIATLSSKYGLDPSDIDGLASSVDADNSMFEDKAFEMGLTVDQYRNLVKIEQENNRLKAEREQMDRQRFAQEFEARLNAEADILKQKFPSFDLNTELGNPQFADLVRNHVSLESAYVALHSDDILQGAMAYTAQTVAKRTADNIAARGNRPVEGGMSGQATAVSRTDVSKLNKADRAELARRAMMGERNIRLR